jgi:hypothetical protein
VEPQRGKEISIMPRKKMIRIPGEIPKYTQMKREAILKIGIDELPSSRELPLTPYTPISKLLAFDASFQQE